MEVASNQGSVVWVVLGCDLYPVQYLTVARFRGPADLGHVDREDDEV